ncbi:MAG TPA: hypothetical protein VJL90_02920 [Pseudorhodoplanes sp.]|nr:hypothetical protein [Pseudorhodoplanes sp.]
MFAKALNSALLILILAIVSIAGLVYFHADPSTEALDTDLQKLRREIGLAETEGAKYEGGFIKSLIEMRAETYRLTESMLSAKRQSILRKVQLVYGAPVSAKVLDVDLSSIEADIRKQQQRISDAEAKVAAYSGGLVQSLAIMSLETERFTLAALNLAYYGNKHGMQIPKFKAPTSAEDGGKTPGKIVKDRDAL